MQRFGRLRVGTLILLTLATFLFASCKKNEGFKIEGKWEVMSVKRQGLPLEHHAIRPGDVFEFREKGEYSYSGAESKRGKYVFNLDEKRLVLDGDEYFVYTASGNKLTYGRLIQMEDVFTVELKSTR